MSIPERPPGGSHRRADSSSRLAVLVASLIGIAIIAVIVTVTLSKRGEPANKNVSQPTRGQQHKSSPAPSSAPSSGTSPSGSSSGTSPSGSPTAPTSNSPSSSGTATPPAPGSTTAATQPSAPRLALDVLNDSRITGLAARAASTFRAGGWDVASTGNFRGTDVPETTIFYPDGDKAAADQLATQFGIHRVEAASSGLSETHLTVALARDWAHRG